MSISFVQPKILIMLSVIIMACKGVCIRHRAQKPIGSFGRYATGQKRCQICEIFIKWNGLWCPCCGYRVRTKPCNSKFKEKLRITSIRKKIKLGDRVQIKVWGGDDIIIPVLN